MKARSLLALLSKVDPEAEVFLEYEGNLGLLTRDEVMTGRVDLIELIPAGADRPAAFALWYPHSEHCDDAGKPVLQTCVGLLLGSSSQLSGEWKPLASDPSEPSEKP